MKINVAHTSWQRVKGLLGRVSLPEGEALYIPDCNAIHTWFMLFTIDAIFLDKSGQVLSVRRELRPWRAVYQRGAGSVLEVPSGQADVWIREIDTLLKGSVE